MAAFSVRPDREDCRSVSIPVFASEKIRQCALQQHEPKTNCWVNAVVERFFLKLKMKRVWRRNYAKPEEARADIADYIVGFYNRERLHSTPGYLSPNDFDD